MTSVKRFSRFVLKDEETFALELQSLWKEKREEKPKQNQSELKRCQKRYDELSALIRSLYENLMAGLLPERQYKQLMAQYDSEQAELESKMETMKSEIAEDKSSSVDLRVQYREAGMSEDAIQAMYEFDLGVLNSERAYITLP